MKTIELLSTLGDQQRAMEVSSLIEGNSRFLKAQENLLKNEGAHATLGGAKLIKGAIPIVAAEVAIYLAGASNGSTGGKTAAGLSVLKHFDPETLAYIALKGVFSGAVSGSTITKVMTSMGRFVEAECHAQALQEQRGSKATARIQGVLGKQGNAKMRAKVFTKLLKANEVELGEDWGADKHMKVGEPLMNAVLIALSDIFELTTRSASKRSNTYVQLTDAGNKFIAELTEAAEWMTPMLQPMVTIPRPWDSFNTGCYYEEKVSRTVRLVRTFNKDHRDLVKVAIADGSMKFTLEALNAIQETPWAINGPVYEMVKLAWERKLVMDGFPRSVALSLPDRIEDATWAAYTDVQKKGHRLDIGKIMTRNRSMVSDAAVILRDLSTAERMLKYERFYLPHNLDFRGRVYPVCHFSHQRADHIKAMFYFAEGKRLGPEGGAWLSIHLANCGDFGKLSKRSFPERIQWVNDNHALLMADVSFGDAGDMQPTWLQADQPFMFLAAQLDYQGWANSGFSDEYVSRLAVALDGSNSGLQHYSAALRSPEGALVGLTPSDKPTDVYQVVADTLLPHVTKDAAEGNPQAILCLAAGVGRSLVKRNVMTFAYSSEQYGFRQQLLEDTMRPLDDKALSDPTFIHPYAMKREDGSSDGGFACSGYLAAGVWKAVTEVVTNATEGMAFFKAVAGTLAHEKLPLVWTSPIGLPVMHKYSEWDTKQIKLWLYDKAVPLVDAKPDDKADDAGRVIRRVRANIRTVPTDRIDKDKAKSAVAPNVIHSMDASHLMLTVLDAKDLGISSFALIHDSFGTHAGSTADFFHVIRNSFVEMYENYCPFETVLEAAMATLSDEGIAKLPTLPAKGTLDLRDTLESLYAFA
jgi:DNA-directed RNA polymerase